MATSVLGIGDSVGYMLMGKYDVWGLSSLYGLGPYLYTHDGLASKGYNVKNAAIPGTGSAHEDTLTSLTWADNHLAGLLCDYYRPTKIVVHFGGNAHPFNVGHTAEEPIMTQRWKDMTIGGYKAIISDCLLRVTAPNIVIVTGYKACYYGDCSPTAGGTPIAGSGGASAGANWVSGVTYVGTTILANAATWWPTIKVVDCSDLVPTNLANYLPDTIHPTAAGTNIIATRIATQLG